MAKVKLITIDRPTSVSRELVREVITRNAQSGKFADSKSPKAMLHKQPKK